MDPESLPGQAAVSIGNILTSAQLGSASLLAIPGDFMQSIATRASNNLPLFDGIDMYFKSLVGDRAFMDDIAVQSGYLADELISSVYATTRFTGINTVGPAWSKRVSDTVMRASLMSGHTKSARRTIQFEFMGMMRRDMGKEFDTLPYKPLMERWGITAEEWNAFRKGVPPHSPRKDINFLRPIDILNTDIKNKELIYRKFQEMIIEAARTGVPEATIGAAITLKGNTRPDTFVGLLLHSFAMYKNFALTFPLIYGRLGMATNNKRLGRLGFYAGLGAGMTLVGAMGLQMKEVSKGKDPMAMDNPKFWGAAFLAGGSTSLWGDFMFRNVDVYGASLADEVAGPLVGFANDTKTLAFGDAFGFVDALTNNEAYEAKFAERLTNYVKKYTPGTNIWWSRLALERQIWDRLEELSNPRAYSKRRRKERRQKDEGGNEYFWPMGERMPDRLPHYRNKD
jgi:hypothetical protein